MIPRTSRPFPSYCSEYALTRIINLYVISMLIETDFSFNEKENADIL